MKIIKRKVKNLKEGDLLYTNGETNKITKLWDIHNPDEMYELTFEDGSKIKSGYTHLWYCETKKDLEYKDEFEKKLKNIKLDEVKEMELLTLKALSKLMAKDTNEEKFYKRAAESLGWESELYGKIRLYDKREVYIYIKDMKDEKIPIKVGKVRTTKEIYELLKEGIEVNIPKDENLK
jgi:hypothetical protein